MKKLVFAGLLGTSVALNGCATGPYAEGSTSAHDTQSYCEAYPERCVIAGILATGIVIALIASASNGSDGSASSSSGGGNAGNASDARLKTDIVQVGQTDHGLPLYTFRYVGSTERFSGVVAQDVLERPELAHAVRKGEDGYFLVDYAALGLDVVNAAQMHSAGLKAISLSGA